MCNDTEELWKIWRRIDLSFQNWHKQFDKFWLERWKVSKIYTLMGCFWLKYIMFEIKKYRGVIFHDTREWCKIWRKIWWYEIFMASFCSKLRMYKLKIHRGVVCLDNEKWCKIWRGIHLSVQNWHEKFDEFWLEHSKISKICTLMGCF